MPYQLLTFLFIFSTLLSYGTTLERTGWNLIAVCQDINSSEVDMTNITEVQRQDGATLYSGEWSVFSNLERLEAGYAYWVKGENGISFQSGEASTELVKPLLRTGWNLMGACEDIDRANINMSGLDQIQHQNGETLYSGNDSERSNLNGLVHGYGYWVQGGKNVYFTSKRAILNDPMLLLDHDQDGTPDIFDEDDDNDGVLDNEDYRPLENTIQTNPIYTQRIYSYEQTYISRANPSSNYAAKSSIDIRDLTSTQTFLSVLYFNIDSSYNGKRVDEIVENNLTVKSDTETDNLRFYQGQSQWSEANSITWTSADTDGYLGNLTPEDQIAIADVSSGTSSTARLDTTLATGKNILLADEDGNSRGQLIKDNSEIYLDIAFREYEEQQLTILPIRETAATTQGGLLQYTMSLISAPTHPVRVYFRLAISGTATLSQHYLEFNSSNYNIPQTLSISGLSNESGSSVNRLIIMPFNSEDVNFNGHNPIDIDFKIYETLPKAQSGYAYRYMFPNNLENVQFDLINAPVGMSINAKNGVITWQPDSTEVGSYEFNITAVDQNQERLLLKKVYLEVETNSSNPSDAYYVVPNETIENLTGELGSITNPFTDIEAALLEANQTNIQTIYVRGGRYRFETPISADGIQGTKLKPIVISRLAGERVKLITHGLYGFKINENCAYLTFDGFELDGESLFDHDWVLENLWWNPLGDSEMRGGIGFHVDGHYITIRNNIIHDFFQKGVNIYYGRYVNVLDNIVYNIAHTSLSGGHGIMRKWDMDFFYRADCDSDKNRCHNPEDIKDDYNSDYGYAWRYDFSGNLVFAVEQRIYSRVWAKGYANLTIDEGKAIVTDESNDYYSNSNPRFRISQNLVVYNGIDHIKLKKYHNMQVNNNSVHTDLTRTEPAPDGISEASPLPNLTLCGNLVTSASGSLSIDLKDSFSDADGNDIDPNGERKYENYVSGGGLVTGTLSGITDLEGTDGSDLFENVAENNFSSRIEGAGVSESNLTHIATLENEYAIEVKSTGWHHDHFHTTDTIIKNIPDAIFDRTTYYIGQSTVEVGEKALYIKIKDSDGQWLYNKLGDIDTANGETSVDWSGVNPVITEEYDFDYVDVAKCDECRGAYVYQLIPKEIWFEHYGAEDFNITNSDGTTTEVIHLDINSSTNPEHYQEHRAILYYTAEGKNQLQGEI